MNENVKLGMILKLIPKNIDKVAIRVYCTDATDYILNGQPVGLLKVLDESTLDHNVMEITKEGEYILISVEA